LRPVRRFPHLIPLALIAATLGAITVAVALLIEWIPPGAAEQAGRTDTLMWFLVWCMIVIFVGVTTVLAYSVWKFRAKPGDESDGPPMHGNTKLEIIWTVLPTILLAVVAVWAYLVLTENERLDDDRLQIDVTAEQFAFTFTYPEAGIATGDLRVPVDRQIRLKMRSRDVIHNFWVNELRVKQDIVPGITTYITFNPTRVGSYQVICAELCGVGHGVMRTRIHVLEQDEYARWLTTSQRQVAAEATEDTADAPTPTTP
jgi:cytochrome c oxidase subunit II